MITFIHDQFKTGPLKYIWRHQNEQNPKLMDFRLSFCIYKMENTTIIIIHFYLEHD